MKVIKMDRINKQLLLHDVDIEAKVKAFTGISLTEHPIFMLKLEEFSHIILDDMSCKVFIDNLYKISLMVAQDIKIQQLESNNKQ